MRAVALLPRLACPRCGKLQYQSSPRSGEIWLTCEVRYCDCDFLTITFPPTADGLQILALVGEPLASDLLHSLSPEHAALDVPELYTRRLVDAPDQRAHLLIAVRGHEKHHHRYDDTRRVLSALRLVG